MAQSLAELLAKQCAKAICAPDAAPGGLHWVSCPQTALRNLACYHPLVCHCMLKGTTSRRVHIPVSQEGTQQEMTINLVT